MIKNSRIQNSRCREPTIFITDGANGFRGDAAHFCSLRPDHMKWHNEVDDEYDDDYDDDNDYDDDDKLAFR